MPSGCARIPTSSIFITTSRPQLHFHLATSDQRDRRHAQTSADGAPIPIFGFCRRVESPLPLPLTAAQRRRST